MGVILVPMMLVALLAGIPGWRMCCRAFFICDWRIIVALMCVILPFAFAIPAFMLPFYLSRGEVVGHFDTLNDVMLFGAFPLGVIALGAYVADHVAERPTMALVAGTACFALMMLPTLYFLFADQMHANLEITCQPPL